MLKIINFTHEHAAEAKALALANYNEEHGYVPALPQIDTIPDLSRYADNGLSVAAFDNGKMVGFICGQGVWNNAWEISGLRNVFSPMHANGAVIENRAEIYARLYQAVGEKWVQVGAASHGICLYAHDAEALKQFFRYGFGVRCVDAIREMDETVAPICNGYDFSELTHENTLDVLPLENNLDRSYMDSPFFMFREPQSEEMFLKDYEHSQSVYFVAKYKGQIIAFIRAELDGETFIKETPGYLHVKGAFCLPEHRGKGISHHLLNLLMKKLKNQGYIRLGVDFESFNPSGSGFWLKHFTAYTHSVVRRIDESIIKIQPYN